jgi:hypothetical protein
MTEANLTAVGGIDHIVIVVDDLAISAEAYRRLGFTLSPKGIHPPAMGSVNHTIMLQHDYFELMGLTAPTEINARWRQGLAEGGGVTGIALVTESAEAAHEHWQKEGLSPGAVFPFARAVKRANGEPMEARFALVTLPEVPLTGVRIFVCQQLTREAVWLPELMTHANTARAILKVTFACAHPAQIAAQWQRVIPAADVRFVQDSVVVTAGAHVIELIKAENSSASGARAMGVTYGVADLAATRAVLRSNGLAFTEGEGQITVGAAEAGNVTTTFQPQP